jgi:hypothetical protein
VDPAAELLGDSPVRLPREGRDADREVLEAHGRDAWTPPRRLVLAALLVVVASGWGGYADLGAREHESAALARCQRDLHNAVVSADPQMVAAASGIGPILATTTGQRHRALLASMARPARLLLPEVVRADSRCRAVAIRPWHRSLLARRDAATAYSGALTARLRGIAADGSTYYHQDAGLRRLRRAAGIGVFGGRY